VDRHPTHLTTEGMEKCVADRRIDLARDLRDRDAERDRQVELDVDRVAKMDGDPRLSEAEPFEEPLVRSRREADDAVRSERRRADEGRSRPGG